LSEIIPYAIGAITSAVVDGALEVVYFSNPDYWTDQFPFVTPSPLIPPADDWIAGAVVPGVIYGAGHLAKNKNIEDVGVGALLYGLPMLLKEFILRIGMTTATAGAGARLTSIPTTGQFIPTRPGLGATVRYAPEQRIVTAPKFIPGVLRPKYMHGA
jgi:hypothetical protein